MKKTLELTGGFFNISEWILRFSTINLLWLFFNLPIVFIVINLVYHPGNTFILLVMVMALVLLLFFPATTALFVCVRDWVIKEDANNLLRSYWKYYKENYKRSFFSG